MKLHLGIIKKDGKVVNHRSLLKVCLNPFLRIIGFQIATPFENDKLGLPVICRCPRKLLEFSWKYDINGCEVEKRRRLI